MTTTCAGLSVGIPEYGLNSYKNFCQLIFLRSTHICSEVNPDLGGQDAEYSVVRVREIIGG